MPLYEYRCPEHGAFEVMRPLSTAAAPAACPQCGRESERLISAPRVVRGTQSAWFAAVEHAEKSRYAPEVVTSVPSAGARKRVRMAPLTPQLKRLPRP